MSNPARHAAYLDAMGITRWVRRGVPAPAGAAQTDDRVRRLAELQREVAACTRCGLCRGRTQTVFGMGDARAGWMIIGEGPGEQEDLQGEPFVGPAGRLLNNMLKAIGLKREQVYIANVVKCRPPGNRVPKPEEVTSCMPYLRRQIELIRPRIILAVGRVAAQNLLQTDTTLGRMRQRVYALDGFDIPVVVTYHPAYLLRSPQQKRRAWEDLCFARRLLSEDGE